MTDRSLGRWVCGVLAVLFVIYIERSSAVACGSPRRTRLTACILGPVRPGTSRTSIQLMILDTTRYFPTVYDEVQRQLDKSTLPGVID